VLSELGQKVTDLEHIHIFLEILVVIDMKELYRNFGMGYLLKKYGLLKIIP